MTDADNEFENMDDAWAAALKEQAEAEASEGETKDAAPPAEPEPAESVPPAHRPPAEVAQKTTETLGLKLLLQIPVEVRVRLGSTKLQVNDILQMGQGSIIELDKVAGEELDLMVNERVMGRGEVVVVRDRFGLRVTEIASPQERIKGLA